MVTHADTNNQTPATPADAELIKGIEIAMITTAHPDGTLHSRPMACQNEDFNGILWFLTKIDSEKASDIQRDHHVNVSFADASKRYVSISGSARVYRDPVRAKELWTPLAKAWFSGPEDPQLGVMRVDVEQAEYWNSPHGPVAKLVGFVKAMVTGDDKSFGDHKRLTM